jgi:hypothetical protein
LPVLRANRNFNPRMFAARRSLAPTSGSGAAGSDGGAGDGVLDSEEIGADGLNPPIFIGIRESPVLKRMCEKLVCWRKNIPPS